VGRDLFTAGVGCAAIADAADSLAAFRRAAHAGLVSPRIGWLIDRHGGHLVMPIGSLLAALGLALLVYAAHPAAYLAVWALLGVATAATLYDPAFATLGRIFGVAARRPITVLTLAGGFASTVSWPVTHLLLEAVGWQGTYLDPASLLRLRLP
jgi:MFS family permease